MAGESPPKIPPLGLSEAGTKGTSSSTKPVLSSQKKETKEETKFSLTPRARKATKQLFKELGHVRHSTMHMLKRVEQTLCVVSGTKREMAEAADGVAARLAANRVMTALPKPTRGGAGLAPPPRGPGGAPASPARRPNETERLDMMRELRLELEETGQERDPTEDELEEKIGKMLELRQQANEIKRTTTGQANKPVVDALEKLEASARLQAKLMEPHEAILGRTITMLQLMTKNLQEHETMRDDLFDPVKTDEKIERSVLYQKMNPMAPLPLEFVDKVSLVCARCDAAVGASAIWSRRRFLVLPASAHAPILVTHPPECLASNLARIA
jgi:hypothetical protein